GIRARRPPWSTRPARRPPWEIPTWRGGFGPSPSAGPGRAYPDRLPGGMGSRRRIVRGTWSCRGTTRLRVPTSSIAGTVLPVLETIRRPGHVLFVFRGGDQAEYGTRLDAIVFPAADLGQASGRRRGDVEGRGAGQHLHQPLPLP